MPKVYRAMLPGDTKSSPLVARDSKALGVRIEGPFTDIPADSAGNVHPGTGGMSVAPGWRYLPPHRIPKRLQHLCSKASRNNNLQCWTSGNGEFSKGEFAQNLMLDVDDETHGTLQPDAIMSLADYESSLAATQPTWKIDEE